MQVTLMAVNMSEISGKILTDSDSLTSVGTCGVCLSDGSEDERRRVGYLSVVLCGLTVFSLQD